MNKKLGVEIAKQQKKKKRLARWREKQKEYRKSVGDWEWVSCKGKRRYKTAEQAKSGAGCQFMEVYECCYCGKFHLKTRNTSHGTDTSEH